MDSFALIDIAALLSATVLGAMLFFAGIVAPMVFTHFPEEEAGAFIRRLFPRYYDVLAIVSALAAVLALGTLEGVIMAAVAALFVVSRFWLMPRINAARDAGAAAAQRFESLHRASVIINLAQMLALVVVMVLALA
jgi:hypothetical protein